MADLGTDARSGEHKLAMLRERQLREAFVSIDRDGSGDISLDEILGYLKGVSDEVEEGYVKTVFDQLDTNRNQKVSIEEFVTGYVAQVTEISRTIFLLKLTLQPKLDDLSRLHRDLQTSKIAEKKNTWGIMEGSKLYVRVIEAQKLSSKAGKPNAFVEVMCERQRVQTNVVKENRNPAWMETFEFTVQIGNGEILCNVIHQGRDSEFIGRCSLPLSELRDQKTAARWLPLLDERGQETPARLQVALQWVHSQTKLLEDQVGVLEVEIANEQAEIARLEAELQRLGTSPMGLFQRDTTFLKLERELINRVTLFTDQHLPVSFIQAIQSWESIQTSLLYLCTVLSLLVTFARSDFLSVSLCAFSLTQEWTAWHSKSIRASIASLCLSVLVDLLWVVTQSESVLLTEHEGVSNLGEKFGMVFTLLNLMCKLPLFLVWVKAVPRVDSESLQKVSFQEAP